MEEAEISVKGGRMVAESGDIFEQLNSDRVIEHLLDQKLEAIEQSVGDADAIFFNGDITPGSDQLLRVAIEHVKRKKPQRRSLIFVLQTDGGYIEIVERMVNILRHHYSRVEFLVPDHAMSAGTVLALSGDKIYMDYFSTLGPIDPQVERPDSRKSIPVQGYLAQYNRLLEKDRLGQITTAELNILVSKFDQAEIYQFEQAIELSVTLLKRWLVEYKFKGWKKTENSGKRVTKKMKDERAEQIARELNDSARWHVHGRGIPMEVLRKDLKIKIDDFGEIQELRDAVKSYTTLLADYTMRTRQHSVVVHARGLYFGL